MTTHYVLGPMEPSTPWISARRLAERILSDVESNRWIVTPVYAPSVPIHRIIRAK